MSKIYQTVLADPPWPYNSPKALVGNAGRGKHNIENMKQIDVTAHYNTMSIDELKSLPVKRHIANNAHLYLWTTNGFMVEAHEIAKSWGFKPKTILTWVKKQKQNDKVSMKAGYWYRSCTEHILFAVRGSLRLSGPVSPTAYFLERLPHSVKPDFFYDLIEAQSPGPYLELFARRDRDNWDQWGNEISSSFQFDGIPFGTSEGKELEEKH